MSRAPHILWVDDPEKVEEEGLEERAGKYVRETNALFLNALHSSVNGKIEFLEQLYGPQVAIEDVREEIVDQVRVAMALHIGTAVVFALAKEGLKTWTDAHREIATSPGLPPLTGPVSMLVQKGFEGRPDPAAATLPYVRLWLSGH